MALFQHSLVYGLILSALLMAVMLASLAWNPAIWVTDYPPDIQARFGPPDARTQRQKKVVFVPFLLALVGTLTAAVWGLPAAGLTPSFGVVFASIFLVVFVFNLVDLLVIDWLIFVTWQPRAIVLPGTAGLAGYRDYRFHFIAFLKGFGFCLMSALLTATLSSLLTGRW